MSDSPLSSEELAEHRVPPGVAVAMLEALRTSDTPEETLEEEENLQKNLPRRLGLSDAVSAQIRRYRELARRRKALDGRELADLLTLVSRRPDVNGIFAETGRTFADEHIGPDRISRRLGRMALPAGLRLRLALRGVRRVARDLNPAATVRSEAGRSALLVEGSLLARIDRSGAACAILSAGMARILETWGIAPAGEAEGAAGAGVLHPLCETRRDSCCLWRAAPD